MRNINELIGLIQGIDFDGIINDKEVERLQSWVDRNRNLIYDSEQKAFLEKVEMVLEDHIITEEERVFLLEESDRYIKNNQSELEKIYELNGLIIGIICDGEVNEPEVYRLKKWMDINKKYVDGHESTDQLFQMLEDILEDGIVTEEEQNILLNFLRERIENSKHEAKYNYLINQLKENKNIGADLIDILDNEFAIDDIHQKAEKILLSVIGSYSGAINRNAEKVFISLCLIAMLEYDGNFWGHVRDTYKVLYGRYSTQRVDALIRSIMNIYSSQLSRKNGDRIIQSALENAIVPAHYLSAFFDFIYDIYDVNFDMCLPDNLSEEFEFIYDGLRKNMSVDSDEFEINATHKTYKLIKSTKQLILDKQSVEAIIKLSIIVINLIDKRIWDKKLRIFNPYLKQGFDKWEKNIKETVDGSERRKGAVSRWKPRFVLENNNVFLYFPAHKVKSDYNYWDIKAQVLCDGRVIYEDLKPEIYEKIGLYEVCVQPIKLSKPLGDISYRLLSDKTIIYDSKETLYRDFIVFDSDGFEIKNNSDYKGNAVFCTKSVIDKFENYYSTLDYKLSIHSVKIGDSVVIDNKIFNFTAMVKPGVFGEVYDNCYLVKKDSQSKIPVFGELKYLVFEAEASINDFVIAINHKKYKLSQLKHTSFHRNGIIKYIVELSIEAAGIYEISVSSVVNANMKRIFKTMVGLDAKLLYFCTQLDTRNYDISVFTSFADYPLERNLDISEFEGGAVELIIGSELYDYYLPVELDIYKIDAASWIPMRDELWIGDIKNDSVLRIHCSYLDEVMVLSSIGTVLQKINMTSSGVTTGLPIGFLNTYKDEYDYVVLVFLKDGKKQKAMFCNNKCTLATKPDIYLDYIKNNIECTIRYYGYGNICFRMKDESGTVIFQKQQIKSGEIFFVEGIYSSSNYEICIYEKSKGLSLKKEREMYKANINIMLRTDLIGKKMKIDEIVSTTEQHEEQRYKAKKIYVIPKKLMNDGSFICDVYKEGVTEKYRSHLIKDVTMQMCSQIQNGSMEVVLSNKDQHLFYENQGDYLCDQRYSNIVVSSCVLIVD